VNGVLSDPAVVTCGVPQGSVLGPLLFLLYVNDLKKLPLKGTQQLFADDATLFYAADTVAHLKRHMNEDLELLRLWFASNKLTVNSAKTHYMLFKKPSWPQTVLNVNIGNVSLQAVTSLKY